MKGLTDTEYLAAFIAKDIAEAESLLQVGKVAEAEGIYIKTKAIVERAEASIKAEPMAWRLFWVELAYLLLILLAGYLTHKWPDYWLWTGLVTLHSGAAWFGALGGIAVGFYGLYSHVQARDFDAKYQLWYICKPIMGAIFGWFVFLVYFVGLISVQGFDAHIKTPLVPYAIAFLAGFSERFTIKIIDRLMQVLMTWEGEKSTGTPSKV